MAFSPAPVTHSEVLSEQRQSTPEPVPADRMPRQCGHNFAWLSSSMPWEEHYAVCPSLTVHDSPAQPSTPGRRVTEEQVAMDLQGIEGLQSSHTSELPTDATSSPSIITHTEHVREEGTLTESAYTARRTASAVKAEQSRDFETEAGNRPRSASPPATFYNAMPFSSSVDLSSLTPNLPFQDRIDLQSPEGARAQDAPTETPARTAVRESRRQSSGGYTLVHGSDETQKTISNPPAASAATVAPPTRHTGDIGRQPLPNQSLPHLSASDTSYTSTTAPPGSLDHSSVQILPRNSYGSDHGADSRPNGTIGPFGTPAVGLNAYDTSAATVYPGAAVEASDHNGPNGNTTSPAIGSIASIHPDSDHAGSSSEAILGLAQ